MASIALVAISLSQFLAQPEAPAHLEPAVALVEFARENARSTLPASVQIEDLLYDSQTKKWTFANEMPPSTPWKAPEECRNEDDLNRRRECLKDEDHVLSALEEARSNQAGTWADDLLAEADVAILEDRMR